MADLINSLKIFTSNNGNEADGVKTNARNVPLISIGHTDSLGDSGFSQWRDAMRMVARLPGGLPPEFRIRLWENLADQYLQQRGLEWSRVVARCKAFENSRDEEIADQIQKDLHRTGCTGFSGAKQAVLKRVLVAYAKWNPSVGYCQGFNMIGAMLLQMTGEDELLTLKIFVFLIEGILPQGYFSQGLRGLAIDMAVFREILKLRKPTLHAHLAQLQRGDDNPPLTDVFTMHWFLTLFIHCLPTPSVLRIWDLVLLEGSEVLLRTALVLWAAIETRILCVTSADDFYSVMGVVTREMLEFGLMDPNSLVKCIVSVGQFPFPGLEELRRKHKLIIAQDTPHKSFFLAKRELDNLKRHYATIRQRQRSSSIIHNLENFSNKATSSSRNLVNPMKKVAVVASPKPKPRRANSANKNLLKSTSRSNSLNKSKPTSRGNPGSSSSNISISNNNAETQPRKQVTVPWNMIKKKPKNRIKRTPSASATTSNYNSSGSSSSSTELCDSTSDEENNADLDSVWTDPPPPPPASASPIPPETVGVDEATPLKQPSLSESSNAANNNNNNSPSPSPKPPLSPGSSKETVDGNKSFDKSPQPSVNTTNDVPNDPEKSCPVPEKPGQIPEKPAKVPDQEFRNAEKTVQNAEKTIQNPEKTIQNPEKAIQNPGKSIPSTEKTIQNPEKSIPNPEKTIPNTEKTIPNTEKTIPNTEKTVQIPEKTMQIPEKKMQIPEITLVNNGNTTLNSPNPCKQETEVILTNPAGEDDSLNLDLESLEGGGNKSSKIIDYNDSQHFLEEMSRLGKSDSFYENLSHRICQLQFQNLRILTTCNTIPDPVIMPAVEFSPLPSPMSPLPRSPGLIVAGGGGQTSKLALLGPQVNARLILSPSLNHLSLSTSPRGSVSGPPSQAGTPLVRSPTVHSPCRSDFSDLSRTSSRRTSKSSISSLEDKSLESPITTPAAVTASNLKGLEDWKPKSYSKEESSRRKSQLSPLVLSPVGNFGELLGHPGEASSIAPNGSPLHGKSREVLVSQQVLPRSKGQLVKEEKSEDIFDLEVVELLSGQETQETEEEDGQGGTEDISAVIRENIAILQRLKLKPAFDDDFDDGWSTSSCSEFSDGGGGTSDFRMVSGPSPVNLGGTPKKGSNNPTPKKSIRCNSSSGTDTGRSFSLSRTNSTGSNSSKNLGNLTTSSGRKSSGSSSASNKSKPKKILFNPFPTSRKARVRTAKFGLYS